MMMMMIMMMVERRQRRGNISHRKNRHIRWYRYAHSHTELLYINKLHGDSTVRASVPCMLMHVHRTSVFVASSRGPHPSTADVDDEHESTSSIPQIIFIHILWYFFFFSSYCKNSLGFGKGKASDHSIWKWIMNTGRDTYPACVSYVSSQLPINPILNNGVATAVHQCSITIVIQ